MKRIMFICTSNICRSAMAHGLLEKKIRELNKNIEVYSSGIYANNGEKSTNYAIQIMKSYNVDLSAHFATHIDDTDMDNMDLVLCATVNHKKIMIEEYPEIKDRILTIKEYAECDKNGMDLDINDPFGGSLQGYSICAEEISKCIEKIFKKI